MMPETPFQRAIRDSIREFVKDAPAGQRRVMCRGDGEERRIFEVAAKRLHGRSIRVVESGDRIVWLKLGPQHSRPRLRAMAERART